MTDKGLHYSILKQEDHEIQFEITFQSDYPYFEGHFDGFHILPALLQIHVVVEMTKKYLNKIQNPQAIPNMKFMKPIYQDMKMLLSITHNTDKNQISFKYSSGETVHSQGALRP